MHHQETDLTLTLILNLDLGRPRLAKANNEESFPKLRSKHEVDENEWENESWK